ncbi:MAG TPA: hypothetical protein VK132_10770 [Gemmatimonadales bacterium]|nr:hypothetical protein [Gemmatimonadales bacterium]
MTAGRPYARLVGLWGVITALRWLAALPITEPRIFRDELLHWEMAKAFAAHQPFVFFGHPIDYPAFLYPAVLSLVFHVAHGRLAFDLARGLNAALMSAAVFPAYALGGELAGPAAALACAALAGLTPDGVYSALIMEESLYYPLFVLSSWLCFRVLVRGSARDAVWCGVALCLTYFAKPLALLLVATYGVAVGAWGVLELRGREPLRRRAVALLTRLVPIVMFGAALVVRHALATRGGPTEGAPSELLLSRFYAEELGGALLPPLGPLAVVAVTLLAALALGLGAAPVSALFSRWSGPRDRVRGWLVGFTVLAVTVHVVAGARHTLLLNDTLRPHERYLFALGPLVLTAFLTEAGPRIGWAATALVVGAIVVAIGPLGHLTLSTATTIDAPSLTAPWLLRRSLGPVPAALLAGAAALAVTWGAVRARGRLWLRVAWLAALPLLLNAGWYWDFYRQTYLNATSQLVRGLEERVTPTQRLAVVVADTSATQQRLVLYLRFWLGDRMTAYWGGNGDARWYTDANGTGDAAARSGARYLVLQEGGSACPAGRPVSGLEPAASLRVAVLEVPDAGCGR